MGGPLRSDEQATRAEGTLARTPFAHLLVYAFTKRLTGELFVRHQGIELVARFGHGFVRDVSTNATAVYLGQILYELGAIDTATLNASLAELAEARKTGIAQKHGDLLVARGSITISQLDHALRQQIERKLLPAFELPPDTQFVFTPEAPASSRVEVDPISIVWHGVRAHGDIEIARGVLQRLGRDPLMLDPTVDLARFGFTPEERLIAKRFERGALVPEDRLGTFVAYVLAITKALVPCVEQSRPTRFTTPPGMGQVSAPRVSERVPVHEVLRAGDPTAPAPSPGSSPPPSAAPASVSPASGPPASVRRPPAPAAAVRFSNDGKQNFQNAEVALAQRKLDVAEALCQRAVEDEPRQAEYIALLAWIKSLRTDESTAAALAPSIELLDRALDLFPGCERAYMYRAAIKKRVGDEAGALSDYRTVHTLNPSNVDAAREVRLHDLRARREPEDRKSSGLFQKILKKK